MGKERIYGFLHSSLTDFDLVKDEDDRFEESIESFGSGAIEHAPRLYILSDGDVFFYVNFMAVSKEVYDAISDDREKSVPVAFSLLNWRNKKYAQKIELA